MLETTLQKADWPSVFSSVHPPDVSAKQCKEHIDASGNYGNRAVVTDWQSSPILKKVVDSIVQSIKLNVEGYGSELDETYSLVKQSLFETRDGCGQIPSGHFPLIRFRPRPPKKACTVPIHSATIARSHPHNWGPWSRTASEPPEPNSERSSESSYGCHV